MNSILLCDGYKLSHHQQYPEGTTLVFSNFTPRSDSHAPEGAKGGVVVFGIQMMLQMIHEHFAENFFKTEENFYASPESLEPGIRTKGREIFKDPVTDSGMKKSAKGLLKVIEEKGTLSLKDGITWDELEQDDNLLKIRYKDGQFFNTTTLEEIREILK